MENKKENRKKRFFSKIWNTNKKIALNLRKASDFVVDKGIMKINFLIILLAIIVVSLLLRYSVVKFQSSDFMFYLNKWCDAIKSFGGFSNFKEMVAKLRLENQSYPPYDYTMPYLFVLTFASYFEVTGRLVVIKTVSIAFDFLLAVIVGLIVKKVKKTNTSFLLGFGLTLFLPNILLNGAVWGQCDVMFSALIVLSMFFFINGKSKTAMFFYGFSLSLKLQAIFFIPVVFFLMAKKKASLFSFLMIFVGIFVINIPALLFGVSPYDTFILPYVKQVSEYNALNMNAPNFYVLIDKMAHYGEKPDEPNLLYKDWFVHFADWLAIGGIIVLFAWLIRRKGTLDIKNFVSISYLYALVVPFLLPKMHERYWVLADCIALIFCLINPKKFYIAVLGWYATIRCCINYLFDTDGLNGSWNKIIYCVMLLATIVLVIITIYKEFVKKDSDEIGTILLKKKPALEVVSSGEVVDISPEKIDENNQEIELVNKNDSVVEENIEQENSSQAVLEQENSSQELSAVVSKKGDKKEEIEEIKKQ